MSLRAALGTTYRRLTWSLLAIGLGIVLLQSAATVAIRAWAHSFDRLLVPFVTLLGNGVVLVFLTPLLVALYGPVMRGTRGGRETVSSAVGAVRDLYWRLFRTAGITIGLVVAAGIFAVTLWLLADTVLAAVGYVIGDPGPPRQLGLFQPLILAFTVGTGVSVLLVQFADLAVVVDDVRPGRAWRQSLQFIQQHPVSVVGISAVCGLLLWIPAAVANVVALRPVDLAYVTHYPIGAYVVTGSVIVVVNALSLTVLAVLRVAYFQRTREPGVSAPSLPPLPWRGIGMATLLLFVGVAGATYVRSVDVGVGQAPIQDLPEDPTAAYDVAGSNTANANHRLVVVRYNETTDSEGPALLDRSAIDYDDRRITNAFHNDNETVVRGYFSEAVLASWSIEGRDTQTGTMERLTRYAGNWTITKGSGYGLVQRSFTRIRSSSLNWTLHRANESVIIYRIDDVNELPADSQSLYSNRGGENLSAKSYAVTLVDRERGVIEEVRLHYHWSDTGVVHTYVRDYSEVGSATVERPSEFGPRRPLERVFDVLYY